MYHAIFTTCVLEGFIKEASVRNITVKNGNTVRQRMYERVGFHNERRNSKPTFGQFSYKSSAEKAGCSRNQIFCIHIINSFQNYCFEVEKNRLKYSLNIKAVYHSYY